MAIQIHQLSHRYPAATTAALNAVSFSIPAGSFFGLTGPNGSGKTTLISILTGLITATAGFASIYGYDVKRDRNKIKSFIGLVPQEIALYPSLTLYENLKLFADLYGLTKQQSKIQINTCLEMVGLNSVMKKQVSTYSGGMLRRANLAIGLLHQPKLLFLDEPTANVDAHAREMLFTSLRHLHASGTTIVYTTHYLEEIDLLCTDLAILKKGVLIATGSMADIKQQYPQKNRLSEIYFNLTEETHAFRVNK